MKHLFLLLLASVCFTQTVQGQPAPTQPRLVINEFLSSNSTGITDEDGDASDWLELYNAGADTLHLAGFGISDNAAQPMKWVFPNVSVAPNAFLLLWCSGKNRVQQALHTNFSISAAGEPLLLSDSMGVLLDSIGPLALPTDLAYGRQQDGDSLWVYFNSPTPGSSNNAALAYTALLQPLQLSHQSGFYNSPFQLSISSQDTGIQILYTLDGSEPDPANLGGRSFLYKQLFPEQPGDPVGDSLYESIASYAYQQAIHISDPSADSNRWSNIAATYSRLANHYPNQSIRKARVVRAKAFRTGALSAPTQSATYFVDSTQGRGRYELPVVSIAANPRYLHDYNIGLWTPGVDFDQWRASRPNDPIDPGMPANYHRTGIAWEYPVHFDYFETQQSQTVLSHTTGLRVHGGYGRALPRKAIRLYARSSYGESTFDHQLFPQQHYTRYKRLLFRNSDFGSTNTRDAIIQTFADGLSFETQAYRPVILFVNGEYWGLIAQHERYDHHYFERKYGIVEAEIDLLASRQEVEIGDTMHYAAMLTFMAQQQMSDSAAYAQLNTLMDVENFTDYWLANIYAGNEDWPHQNIRYWRKRVVYSPGAGQHDGRWRWLMFDIDWGLDPTSVRDHLFIHTSSQAAGSDRADWSTFIVRKLLENPGYRDYFINRLLDLLNTSFHSDRTVGILDSLEQLLYPYIPEQIGRWNELRWGPMQWLDNMNGARFVLQSRADTLRQSLERRFGLSQPMLLQTGVNDIARGTIKINTVLLHDSVMPNDSTYWHGQYYRDIPLQFEAVPKRGHRFAYWIGLPDSLAGQQQWLVPQDTVLVRAVFEVDSTQFWPKDYLHHWHFNRLATGSLSNIAADFSMAAARITYPGQGAGYVDRVNDGSLLQAIPGQPAGYAMRVRNPANTRDLVLQVPTSGFKDLSLHYAISRTSNGATLQQLSYRTAASAPWVALPYTIPVTETYQAVDVDLSEHLVLNNQAQLELRVSFIDQAAGNSSGNNRFDNVSLRGIPTLNYDELLHYWHFNELPAGTIDSVASDYSRTGYGWLSFPGTGAGYLDAVAEEGALALNLFGQTAGDALRVRNPSAARELTLNCSSNGALLRELKYFAQRTNNGAAWHRLEYFNPHLNSWELLRDSIAVGLAFELKTISLQETFPLHDQDTVRLRLQTFGPGAANSAGNQRFDNLVLLGTQLNTRRDTVSLCPGTPWVWRGDTLLNRGMYYQLVAQADQDTLFSLFLEHSPTYNLQQQVSFCVGGFYIRPNGDTTYAAGIYVDSLVTSAGCDSVIVTDLRSDTLIRWSEVWVMCSGDSLQLPDGRWVLDAGLYSGRIIATLLCDTAWSVQVALLPRRPVLSKRLDTLFSSAPFGNQWYRNGLAIAGAREAFLVLTENGSYSVQVDTGFCQGDFSEPFEVLNSSIAFKGAQKFFKLYPNPTAASVILEWSEPAAGLPTAQAQEAVDIRIYNSAGQQVLQQQFLDADVARRIRIDVSHLPVGLYLVKIETAGHYEHARLMIVR